MGGRCVPVTVVSGFLGAGKSTLVRRILTEDHGLRVLVVENELGEEVGIESVLVTEGANRDAVVEFVELPNGCVCCTVKDELTDSLSRVVHSGKGFDRVVIETSGMADPGPVAALFWVDEELELGLELDGIITLVDSLHAPLHMQDMTFQKQLAIADLVLMNKVDLVSEADVGKLENSVRSLAPFAAVQRTSMAECDLREALQLDTLRHGRVPAALSAASMDALRGDDHGHDPRVSAVTLAFGPEVAFDAEQLTRQIGQLTWEREGGEVWRMKALVSVGPQRDRWAYQGVHDLFDGEPYGEFDEKGPKSSFIFIGLGLDRETIRQTLDHAAIKPA